MMATYIQLFFAATDPRPEVVKQVSEAISAELTPVDEVYADYLAKREDLVFDLKFGHELEDDAGIPFERMPVVLTVRGLTRNEDRHRAEAIAAFDRLDKGYTPAYVVRGLGKILAHRD